MQNLQHNVWGTFSPALDVFRGCAETAHEVFKQATLFFKAYCISSNKVPPTCHSMMIVCIQQVITRSTKGARGRATELVTEMERFWKERF